MNFIQRINAPLPRFFNVLRTIGLVVASVGGVILAAPVSLPVVMTTIGGYMVVAGGVLTAVSQMTSKAETEKAVPDDST